MQYGFLETTPCSTNLVLKEEDLFNAIKLKKEDLFNDADIGDSGGEKREEKLGMESHSKPA